MYICVCVCVYVYVFIYICICMCVYIYMYLYITCMCSLFDLALWNEDGGVQLVYETRVAWRGGLFLTEGKIVVLSVSSLFLTRVGVYVCVSVCIRTHTHTLHRCSDVSPGAGMRHLEGPRIQMD